MAAQWAGRPCQRLRAHITHTFMISPAEYSLTLDKSSLPRPAICSSPIAQWQCPCPVSKRLWVRVPQVELIFLSFFLSFRLTHSSHISIGLLGVGSGARITDNSEVFR